MPNEMVPTKTFQDRVRDRIRETIGDGDQAAGNGCRRAGHRGRPAARSTVALPNKKGPASTLAGPFGAAR